MKKVILNIGSGSLAAGYSSVIGEFLGESSTAQSSLRFSGKLPPAPELQALQQRWQKLYAAHNQDQALRIHLLDVEGIRYSLKDFQKCSTSLADRFNAWLSTPDFLSIDRALRTELKRDDNVQVIIETSDALLRRLPWHLWQLFEDYPLAELAFGAQQWRSLTTLPAKPKTSPPTARILAVLGNSAGLDTGADLAALNRLSHPDNQGSPGSSDSLNRSGQSNSAHVTLSVLKSPTLRELHEQLWNPQGWDIFFFAGHSQTEGETGVIDLNQHERLTVAQIKHALSRAIANGLKIAIFNSCDGLGLAQQVADLQIPYVVVMREPVPDAVAQQFLQHLLFTFSDGLPFHLAVREARQRLAGLENTIPCASWLPVIWQNPTAPALYWKAFFQQAESVSQLHAAVTPQYQQAAIQPVPQPVSTPQQAWQKIGLKSLVISACILGIRALGLLEPIELSAYDQLIRQRPTEAVDDRIVVVEVDEEATSQYGYPLPDAQLTALIDRLNMADPLAIGLDLHRSKPTGAKPTDANPTDTNPTDANPTDANPTDAKLTTENTTDAVVTQEITNLSNNSSSSEYNRFIQQVQDNPTLFLVCFYNSADANYATPAQLPEELKLYQVGFSDIPIDRFTRLIGSPRGDLTLQGSSARLGESVRRQWLSYDPTLSPASQNCETPYSLSFQLVFQYLDEAGVTPLDVTEDENWQFGSVEFAALSQRTGGYQRLAAHSGQIFLNYRANQPGEKVTYSQIMSDNFDGQLLTDKVVLVGYTAPVSKDYFETPYGPMAGLWVHAHMVSQMLSSVLDGRPLVHGLPQAGQLQWGDWLWVLAWASAGGYAGWKINRQPRWMLSILLGGLALYGTCWTALLVGLWLPLVPSGAAALGSSLWLRLSRH